MAAVEARNEITKAGEGVRELGHDGANQQIRRGLGDFTSGRDEICGHSRRGCKATEF